MAERRKAADDAEVAFYNEQIEDVKGTLETAKQMEPQQAEVLLV
jgi:hypothetical protein